MAVGRVGVVIKEMSSNSNESSQSYSGQCLLIGFVLNLTSGWEIFWAKVVVGSGSQRILAFTCRDIASHSIGPHSLQQLGRIYKIATKMHSVWRMRSGCTPKNPCLQFSNGAPRRTAQRKPHPSATKGPKPVDEKPPETEATNSKITGQWRKMIQKPMVF